MEETASIPDVVGAEPSALRPLPARHLSTHKQMQYDVKIPEYMHYASITRAKELRKHEDYKNSRGPTTFLSLLKDRFHKGHHETQQPQIVAGAQADISEKNSSLGTKDGGVVQNAPVGPRPSDWESTRESEMYLASRVMRTAGWGAAFYLISADILGASSSPWTFAQTGYGPGFAMYAALGGISGYSGWLLWKMFLGTDSDRFPVHNYADLMVRLVGRKFGYLVHVFQALQLILGVAYLILYNGQAISQISMPNPESTGLCFIACVAIFAAVGMIAGQVRTLQRFSWMANFSIFIQTLSCIIMMILVAYFPPAWLTLEAAYGLEEGPILTYAGTPPDGLKTGGDGVNAGISAASVAIASCGGAFFFPSFLAEMRHPMDFWKALILGQLITTIIYIVFGMEVYAYYGQFTYFAINQGIGNYAWQTAMNVTSLIVGLVGTCMYANIGLKIAYMEVLQPLGAPGLSTTKGKFWWAVSIPLVWGICFAIAPAIPQLATVSSFGGALFGTSFNYIFPSLAALIYFIREDAIIPDVEHFDETTRTYSYVDHGWTRFVRGAKKRPFFHGFNFIFLLCSLGTCIFGCIVAVEQAVENFQSGVSTSFSCTSPV